MSKKNLLFCGLVVFLLFSQLIFDTLHFLENKDFFSLTVMEFLSDLISFTYNGFGFVIPIPTQPVPGNKQILIF